MKRKYFLRHVHARALDPESFADYRPSAESPRELGPVLIAEEARDWLWVKQWRGAALHEHPIYLNRETAGRIEGYFRLMEHRPELFLPSPLYPIVTDRLTMLRFEKQTGKKVGIVYDNNPYFLVVADLIGEGKKPFTYARVLYPRTKNGCVVIPYWERDGEEPLFGILNVFRHSIRCESGGEFPRGFWDENVTIEENAVKELGEELGIAPSQIKDVCRLGETRADTGLCAGEASVFLARIGGTHPAPRAGHEGILGTEWLTRAALLDRVKSGKIVDGFTLNALLLFLTHEGPL